MACSHDTQTRPEFTYLFLGAPSDKPNTTPVALRAEANNEQQARSHFLNWNLVFAAQIRTKAPCRLQLMDGADRFSWIFEQLPDVCTSVFRRWRMSELTRTDALIEIEALACAAQFLTDTPARIELAGALMSQIEETAKKAQEASDD
ncbi:Uncharacterised protein [Salmonella enterica subsp. enterica]|uniref:Host cell division inhibitor Icd-like protein n=6 Tax=Salmonella enterica TaxID=28901 RepID=A0A379V342_SALET|nr:Uncharacterised protein [Salmonella enterica subsp. enterica]